MHGLYIRRSLLLLLRKAQADLVPADSIDSIFRETRSFCSGVLLGQLVLDVFSFSIQSDEILADNEAMERV